MTKVAKPLAILALLLTIGPPVAFLFGKLSGGSAISENALRGGMLVGTVLWFAAAPHWLREDD